MVSAKFNEVFEKTRKITKGPSNDELLDLYALAKIAKGESNEGKSRPGVFSAQERAKYDAVQKWSDEGISAADAEKRYIDLGEGLISKYL